MTQTVGDRSIDCPSHLGTRWLRSHLKPKADERVIVLNLRDCTAVRHLAQSWIIGQCAAWNVESGPELRLILPADSSARAMFVESGFLRVLSKLVERPISEIVLDELTELEVKPQQKSWRIEVPRVGEPANFIFPYYLYDARYARFHQAAVVRESMRWREPYLLTVLQQLIGDGVDQISTQIVQEAALVAIGRPEATLLATSAALSHDSLTLTIWDNGIATSEEFERFLGPGQMMLSYSVGLTSDADTDLVFQGFTPSKLGHAGEHYLGGYVAPPGVSSGSRLFRAADRWTERLRRDPPFMAVANAALDIFQGELTFLSGATAITLRKEESPEKPQHYSASIVRYPDSTRLAGNIASVRIPFRRLET